ncbi:MAG: hypothetical protein EBR30_23420 [Cytophagia bacterium]|nr:hypothetical protein [Cytophagia bacterium]
MPFAYCLLVIHFCQLLTVNCQLNHCLLPFAYCQLASSCLFHVAPPFPQHSHIAICHLPTVN